MIHFKFFYRKEIKKKCIFHRYIKSDNFLEQVSNIKCDFFQKFLKKSNFKNTLIYYCKIFTVINTIDQLYYVHE